MKQVRLSPRLRRRVRIEQPSLTPDGQGGYSRGWSELATVWASVEPLSGREQIAAGRLESNVTYRVTLRYRSDIRPDMRLVYQKRPLAIRAVINANETKHRLEILAEEGVST